MRDSPSTLIPRCGLALALTLSVFPTTVLAAVGAEIDVRLVRSTALQGAALDVTTSADGQRTYVLLAGGKVDLFDARGAALGTLQVAKDARAIAVSPDGSVLTVVAAQELQAIAVALVQEIDVAGSPLRGPADAPVTIAVFNDFQ